jgi:exopolysaccharide biosynthesis polyprenyl glycosylphosphotransferase
MSTADQVGVLDGFDLYDEMTAAVDSRTLEIVERRRRTAVVRRRGWLVKRMLLAADLAGLVTAIVLAETVVDWRTQSGILNAHLEVAVFLGTLPIWIVVAKLYGLYDHDEERTDHSTADDFIGVFHMVTVCTFLFWGGTYLTKVVHAFPAKLLLFWALAIALVTTARAVARGIAHKQEMYLQNTVIVGAGDVGQLIARKLLGHPEYGINLVGFVDSAPKERGEGLEHLAILGGPERLPAIVRLLDVERIVFAFSNESLTESLRLLQSLRSLPVRVDIVPRLFETLGPNVGMHMVEGLPLVGLPPKRISRSSGIVKRGLDLALAVAALVLLTPLLLLIALLVKLDSRGPVLYRHERVGLDRRRIDVFKFRTMYREASRGARYGGEAAEQMFRALMDDPRNAAEFGDSYKLKDDPRITRVGAFLRRTSLDELPQLLNVVLGELSLVGPRPITLAELPRYGDAVDELLGTRPGVTGYWQINGRSRLSYDDRIRLDLSYIRGWSLRLDLEILAKTLRVFVTGDAY